jgi:hypothetical protein
MFATSGEDDTSLVTVGQFVKHPRHRLHSDTQAPLCNLSSQAVTRRTRKRHWSPEP